MKRVMTCCLLVVFIFNSFLVGCEEGTNPLELVGVEQTPPQTTEPQATTSSHVTTPIPTVTQPDSSTPSPQSLFDNGVSPGVVKLKQMERFKP